MLTHKVKEFEEQFAKDATSQDSALILNEDTKCLSASGGCRRNWVGEACRKTCSRLPGGVAEDSDPSGCSVRVFCDASDCSWPYWENWLRVTVTGGVADSWMWESKLQSVCDATVRSWPHRENWLRETVTGGVADSWMWVSKLQSVCDASVCSWPYRENWLRATVTGRVTDSWMWAFKLQSVCVALRLRARLQAVCCRQLGVGL